ncbi:MAG: phosphonate utilization protein [Burkholderiaceae bacterium]|nr:phosphonate utilization protein [Burkholderiaceae bacterium]
MGDCHFGDCNFDDEHDSPMSGFVFSCILGAALMHALWNILLKSASDKNLETAVANFATAILALPLLVIYGLPDPQTFPYIALSIALHLIYFYLVASAYRFGDLNLAYPIMRGAAPLLTLLFGYVFLREQVSDGVIAGIFLVSAGVILLGLRKTTSSAHHLKALLFALGNAIVIALYTIVDGHGVRLSNNAWSYVSLLMFSHGCVFLSLVLWQRHRQQSLPESFSYIKSRLMYPLIGGTCIIGSYSIALWAMTQAPISLVAAVRETSVLFAFLFGTLYLKESPYPQRMIGALGICLGLILIRIY